MDDPNSGSIDFNGDDCMIDEILIIAANIFLIPLIIINKIPKIVLIPIFIIDVIYVLIWMVAIGTTHIMTKGEVWSKK